MATCDRRGPGELSASITATRKLLSEYEQAGKLPPEMPSVEGRGITIFARGRKEFSLKWSAGGSPSISAVLKAHLDLIGDGDHFAVPANIEMSEAHERALQRMRQAVRDKKLVATSLGFGPRFLRWPDRSIREDPTAASFCKSPVMMKRI